MSQGLYLGRQVDPASGALGAKVELDPADLVTHGLIVGMTGSGKTGLAVALLEEVLRQGIPVLAIDPKGDLGNLLLLFDRFDGDAFLPWIDRDAARREGKAVAVAAAEKAAVWERGLAEWGLGADDARAVRAAREAVIFTPGSRSGVPLDVLHALEAAPPSFDDAAEDLRDDIAGIVAGLLGLVKLDADPLQSTEAVFLANLIETSWRNGKALSLEALVAAVAEPPMEKIGALPLETVYPRKERQKLMLALNNLLASPSFGVWREGEPLDIQNLLWTADGRPRLSIIYTAHLSEEERLFVTALVLEKVKSWTRRQSGTSELRALVYMDEVFGYFPPHPANPPTKRPLLTLLKQARAQGTGVVLATQNPVDLDYKALANMGLWAVGTLQTQRDRDRLQEGLTGAGLLPSVVTQLLDATKKRVFLLHDVHRGAPTLLHSRFALSFLRGPFTREDVERLTNEVGARRDGAEVPAAGEAAPEPLADSGAPPLPAPFRNNYYRKYGGELADPCLFARFAVRYKGATETILARAWPLTGATAAEILDNEPMDIDVEDLATEPPAGVRHGDLPSFFVAAGGKGVERALKDRLSDKLAATILEDPVSGESSFPGESREAFALRLTENGGGAAAQKLRQKLEKKQQELQARQEELRSRSQEKWGAIAGAVLGNIGLLTGRKRTVSGVGGVLAKNRMENSTESKVEALQAEVTTLADQVAALTAVDPARFTSSLVEPPKNGVKLLRFDLVWVY